jgi:hypothetical protein
MCHKFNACFAKDDIIGTRINDFLFYFIYLFIPYLVHVDLQKNGQ